MVPTNCHRRFFIESASHKPPRSSSSFHLGPQSPPREAQRPHQHGQSSCQQYISPSTNPSSSSPTRPSPGQRHSRLLFPDFFAFRSSYQPRGNLLCMSSAQVGFSAEGQGFLNVVPASLAQCDGRFLFSAPVAQEVHELNILYTVFNTQVQAVSQPP